MADNPDDEGWVLYPPLEGSEGEAADFGTSFFDPAGGGEPVLFQHVFWLLGHWEVYPALMLFGAFLAVLIRRCWSWMKLGLKWQMLALVLGVGLFGFVAISGFRLWAGIYAAGLASDPGSGVQSLRDRVLLIIGAPAVTGLVMLVFILTAIPFRKLQRRMSNGQVLDLVAPDLVSGLYLGGVALFLAANICLTWQMNAQSVDRVLHDTYYIHVHWHYALVVLTIWAAFWGGYRLFDKIMGVRYHRVIGVLQFVCFATGISLIFLPQFFVFQNGMPRRYVDYDAQFTLWSRISSFGYIILLVSLLLVIVLVAEALIRKNRLKKNN